MNYGNRGKQLEQMVETSNRQYSFQGRAIIQKIPTPVKVLDINSRTGKIRSGYYERKSTVDYIGVYKGIGIAFDAKETSVETRFDLSNIKEHQYNYLKKWVVSGGIAFLLLHFNTLDQSYYLPFELLKKYWEGMIKGGRKSIPYQKIAQKKYKIASNGLIILDYLDIIDDLIK